MTASAPERAPKSLAESRSWCVLAYLVAVLVGAAVWLLAPVPSTLWRMALADVVATVVIFGFSFALNNSSMYDAYWSVAPIFVALGWSMHPDTAGGDDLRQLLTVLLVAAWGVRLTLNWGTHWRGMQHEDWRYVDMRESTGKAYWLVSLAGLHMFPTVMVMLNLWSLHVAMFGSGPIGTLDVAATLVTVGAILIETFADRQLHAFVARNRDPDAYLADGLWAYSRHPNYFGELSFWWGLWLFAMAADSTRWWTVVGPLAMTAMFWFVSIPLIDKRMLRKRPHYAEHASRVSRLVPWFPRERKIGS